MGLKRKIKLPTSHVTFQVPTEKCSRFFNTCRKLTDVKEFTGFINQKYFELYGTLPPDGVTYEWLKIKIGYRLLVNGYQECGKPIPPKVQKAFDLAQDPKDLDKLAELFPSLNYEGDRKMRKKVKIKKRLRKASKKSGTSSGSTMKVFEGWIKVMSENFKLKLTDSQLTDRMCKLFPNKKTYTEADIRAHRTGYNHGRIKSQTSAPKVKLPQFSKGKRK